MAADLIDLRAKIEYDTNQVLDALAISRSLDKSEVVRKLLKEATDKIRHESNVVVRVTRGEGVKAP